MRRWYVTLRIQMAVDADGNLSRDELESQLSEVDVENKYRPLTFYNPDQVDVEYLEPADA